VLEFSAHEPTELLRRRADDLESHRAELLPYIGFGQSCDKFAVEAA